MIVNILQTSSRSFQSVRQIRRFILRWMKALQSWGYCTTRNFMVHIC